MCVVNREQIEKVLAESGLYIEDFGKYRIEVSKNRGRLKITGTHIESNEGFKRPNITNISTYEQVQNAVDINMVYMRGVFEKNINNLLV